MKTIELMQKIEAIVCAGEEIHPDLIHVRNRRRDLKETRQIIMFFAKKKTGLSYASIAGYFKLDHATAIHAIQQVNNWYETDKDFREKIDRYEQMLKNETGLEDVNVISILAGELKKDMDDLRRRLCELETMALKLGA